MQLETQDLHRHPRFVGADIDAVLAENTKKLKENPDYEKVKKKGQVDDDSSEGEDGMEWTLCLATLQVVRGRRT